MNIFVTGINHKKTPVEIREKFSLASVEQEKVMNNIIKLPGVSECAVISTCNRTEIYIYSNDCNFNGEIIENFLCDFKGLDLYSLKKHFYFYSSVNAVRHLIRVASGLDSQVLGEDQILGQVKGAYEKSREAGFSGAVLNTLFRDAVTAAKRVKTYTEVTGKTASIGAMAVDMIYKYYEETLMDKTALIIGSGTIGKLTFESLVSKGIGRVYVTNRTHGNMFDISGYGQNIEIVGYNDRYSVLEKCDIVISSTKSPHYTITRDMVEKYARKERETVFVDLAVPRDIDVSIKNLSYVKYFNMDNLDTKIDCEIDLRLIEMSKAEEIIDEYVIGFEKWYGFRKSLPLIEEIKKVTDGIFNRKINSTLEKLNTISQEEKEMLSSSVDSTMKDFMDIFLYSVREQSSKEDMEVYFRCLENVIRNL